MTEQLHTISIPGLPDGWRAVAYRYPKEGEYFLWEMKPTLSECDYQEITHLIIEKIQPRRIVLEETGEDNMKLDNGELATQFISLPSSPKIWQVVEEEEK